MGLTITCGGNNEGKVESVSLPFFLSLEFIQVTKHVKTTDKEVEDE